MLKPATLKNGMTVIKIPKNSADSFVIGFVVKTGSSAELDNYPLGISSLIERLFWKGTDKHQSLTSLNQTLEGMGGEFLSNTGKELTEYYLRVPSYHQYKAISLLSEIIQHSMFTERDIENTKNDIISELKDFENIQHPNKKEMALSHLFEGDGLGTPPKGTIESMMMIQQQHIADYLAHQYVPSNCYLVLSGNFDTKQCMELIEQEWSLWNPRSLEPRHNYSFFDLTTENLPAMQFRQRGLASDHISVSFILDGGFRSSDELLDQEGDSSARNRGPEQKEQLLYEWSRLLILNTILGKGLSSRLWSKCVEDEVLFETIGSNIELFTFTGFIQIGGVSTESTQFSFAFESILSVIDALKKTTVSINEFTKAREYLKGRLLLDNEDLIANTIWHVNLFIATGIDIEISELIEYIQKVDSNEIRSLSMDLFVPQRMVLTTVGTAKHTVLMDKLVSKYLGSVTKV